MLIAEWNLIQLSKKQILDKLWDCEGNYIDNDTLTVYMRRLRMKVEDNRITKTGS